MIDTMIALAAISLTTFILGWFAVEVYLAYVSRKRD